VSSQVYLTFLAILLHARLVHGQNLHASHASDDAILTSVHIHLGYVMAFEAACAQGTAIDHSLAPLDDARGIVHVHRFAPNPYPDQLHISGRNHAGRIVFGLHHSFLSCPPG
jgi:hypothetical protein